MSILLWRVYVENWGYGYCMSLGIMGFRGTEKFVGEKDEDTPEDYLRTIPISTKLVISKQSDEHQDVLSISKE
ncbi:unnamed protein product, partial [Brenthis ino]